MARCLKCDDFCIVNKFLQVLQDKFVQHNIHARLKRLHQEITGTMTPEQEVEYEKLDKLITDLCLHAEHKCRKFRAGNVPFSPIIDMAAKTIYFWSLMIRKAKGCKVSSKLIHRVAAKCELIADNTFTLQELEEFQAQAHKRYRSLKPTAKQSRIKFIMDLADAIEEVFGEKKANTVRARKLREEQRETSAMIKAAFDNHITGSISKLEVPKADNPAEFEFTEDKDVMENALISANKIKFSLTEGTPSEWNLSRVSVVSMGRRTRAEKYYWEHLIPIVLRTMVLNYLSNISKCNRRYCNGHQSATPSRPKSFRNTGNVQKSEHLHPRRVDTFHNGRRLQ